MVSRMQHTQLRETQLSLSRFAGHATIHAMLYKQAICTHFDGHAALLGDKAEGEAEDGGGGGRGRWERPDMRGCWGEGQAWGCGARGRNT